MIGCPRCWAQRPESSGSDQLCEGSCLSIIWHPAIPRLALVLLASCRDQGQVTAFSAAPLTGLGGGQERLSQDTTLTGQRVEALIEKWQWRQWWWWCLPHRMTDDDHICVNNICFQCSSLTWGADGNCLHQDQFCSVTGCEYWRSSGCISWFYSVIKQQWQPSLSLFRCCVINLEEHSSGFLCSPVKVADKDMSVRVNAALWGLTFQLFYRVFNTAVKQPSCSDLHV